MKFYGLKCGRVMFSLGGPQGLRGVQKHSWGNDPVCMLAWKTGNTGNPRLLHFHTKLSQLHPKFTPGFPLIDANMRELVATGYMSNRGRQVVASFLVRDLGQDWRLGAEFFESHLLDHDVCSNYGNWQYSAGVGSDPRLTSLFLLL